MTSAQNNRPDQHVVLTRGASYLIMQNLGVNAITIAGFVVLARLISTKEMGVLAILLLVQATCSTFATWFPQAVTKYVAENVSSGSNRVGAAAFYQSLRVNLIIYLGVVAAIYFGASFLASHLLGEISYTSLFQVLAFDVMFSAGLLQVVVAALLGLKKFREIALVGIIIGLFRQILIIFLIILLKNFVGLVIAWLISDAACTVIYLGLAMQALGAPRFDFPIRKLLNYYLPLELAQIVSFAQTWFDRVLLAVSVPLAALGIYNAAITAFGVLGGVSSGMTSMLFPAYSSIEEKTGDKNMRDAVRLATRYASLTLTPLGFGLLATAKPAITLFAGEAYVAGYSPLMFFCAAFAITAFSTALGPLLLALDETKVAAAITGSSVVAGMVAVYLLLPIWGILGASIARALAIILGPALTVIFLSKRKMLELDVDAFAKSMVSAIAMVAVIMAVQLVSYSRLMLPVYVLVGGAVYLIMLRLLKTVHPSDLDLMRRFLGKRLSLISDLLSWIVY